MARTDVKVPDIGDYKNVPVIEVLVAEGQSVEKDAALITLESEKATMEVPAPAAGVVRGIRVKPGDKLSQGDVIMALEAAEASSENSPPRGGESGARSAPGEGVGPAPTRQSAPAPSPPAPLPQKGEGSKTLDVAIPDIGDYHDIPVIEVLVKDGDAVEKDAPLSTLESEKATMEVPAPAAGTVRGLKLKPGQKVSKGTPVCTLELASGAAPAPMPSQPKPAPDLGPKAELPRGNEPAQAAQAPSTSAPTPIPPWVAQAGAPIPHASPMVRRVAREFGVDLARVTGSGPHGRILQDDVQAFVKRALGSTPAPGAAGGSGIPPIPAVDFAQFGDIESKPLARIRKISAAHLHRAWLNVPHVTQHDEADITELENFRKTMGEEQAAAGGPKMTLLPFLMKAAGVALKSFPEFNASLAPDGESLILKKYCHIGFAADTPNGLVVPVVRDVWGKGIVQLAAECGDLAKKARDGKLKPDEMKGGCFSISSLGGIGGGFFTPIVNAPEVAILGVSRAQTKPVWDGKAFQPRLLCPLSLSYDHRVIDGAAAARFVVALGKLLADLRRVAL